MEWQCYFSTLIGAWIQLSVQEDSLHWIGGDRSGNITVKNLYNAISSTFWIQRCTRWRRYLRHLPLPLKIKLFIWLAANEKILTWDNLLRRGWEGPNMCSLCRKISESISHLFLDCKFTQIVWHRITLALKLETIWTGSTLHACLEN
jgi:hypothetical protein